MHFETFSQSLEKCLKALRLILFLLQICSDLEVYYLVPKVALSETHTCYFGVIFNSSTVLEGGFLVLRLICFLKL